MYRSNRSFDIPPPPRGKPRAFDSFDVPGRREFDYQSLPGDGEFDPHALGVGNLNCTLDFMWNLWRGELSWGMRCWRIFVEKIFFFPLWPIGYEEWAWTSFVPCWRYLNFNIFNIGFSFWIYECIKVVFTMKYNTYYRRFNATIKSSTEVNYFDLPHV